MARLREATAMRAHLRKASSILLAALLNKIPNPNPWRPFLSKRRACLRKATAILFMAGVALAIWHWMPYSGFDKVGGYTLYQKYGNNYSGPVEDKPALKLGAFVERDTTRNNVSPATSTSSSTAFTIQGNVY